MGRQLMSPTKVGLKSTNWYKSVMIIEKNYLMLLETSLNVVIVMHIFPTRFDWIIIELSKVATKPWMNKVTNSCWNLILCSNPTKEKKCASCDYKCFYVEKRTWEEENIE
jgi:hypothetical protein